DGNAPRIASYKGNGNLRAWTRVVATRTLLNVINGKRIETPVEVSLLDAIERSNGNAELTLLRGLYGNLVEQALRRAIAALTEGDRLLLRLELSGLSAAKIGRLRLLNPRTMQRRINEVHANVARAF